jgi:hypothetical protein
MLQNVALGFGVLDSTSGSAMVAAALSVSLWTDGTRFADGTVFVDAVPGTGTIWTDGTRFTDGTSFADGAPERPLTAYADGARFTDGTRFADALLMGDTTADMLVVANDGVGGGEGPLSRMAS